MYVSFGMWMGVDILLVVVAACMVIYYAPTAAGSGIPEVKCYLNGLKIPQVVRLKTLLVKIFGASERIDPSLHWHIRQNSQLRFLPR